MKVTVSVIDRRTKFGTSNREFWSYLSAYKYIKAHLDTALAVVIKCESYTCKRTIPEFISFMEMEELQC